MMWESLLEQLSKKLFSCGNKYLSLGGRIVLLNLVLNAIPIFYLSFFKMPVTVVRKVVRIQREFLCSVHFDRGGFLKGFLFEPVIDVATDFPFVFFSPPKLISASCTGLLVNNICRFKKKKKLSKVTF
jgi:hypothetical protein